MSRARHRRRSPAAPPRRSRAPRARVPAWVWPIVLLGVVLVWWRLRPDAGPPESGVAAQSRAITPEEANDRAVALHRSGEVLASLPFYRRALDGAPAGSWSLHYSYAAALHSVITAHRTSRGVQLPLTRSSDEAARLAHEALARYQRAAELTSEPRNRAMVLLRAGDLYRVWGLQWEAFAAYREAQALDPSDPLIAARGDALMLLLEHPERSTLAGEPTE